ncbi:MAG TPA: STAS domain-containing protein [Symbiobacteriaceae bacterium]
MRTRFFSGGLIVDLSGPLCREAGDEVVRILQDLPVRPTRLVLNFTHVGSIDAAGAGRVLAAVRIVTRAGGEATAYGLTEAVGQACEELGLTRAVRLCPAEASALR